MFNIFHKCSSPSHRRRSRSKSMHELTPRYEVLEVRVVPSYDVYVDGRGCK